MSLLPASPRRWSRVADEVFGARLVSSRGSAIQPQAARTAISTPMTAAALFAPMFLSLASVEAVAILALDAQGRSITTQPIEITRGLLNQSLVHPREVFRAAIVAGAASIIIGHNHPSGVSTASAEDKDVTTALVAAGHIIGIPVRDHVIVAPTGDGSFIYSSFMQAGLI